MIVQQQVMEFEFQSFNFFKTRNENLKFSFFYLLTVHSALSLLKIITAQSHTYIYIRNINIIFEK